MPEIELLKEVYDRNRPSIPDDTLPSVDPGGEKPESPASKFENMDTDTMVDAEISSMVVDRRQSVITYRQEKKIVWDKCWDHMKQVYDDTGKQVWQSRIFQPDTPKVVEVITANLFAALMGPESPIEWKCKVKRYEQQIRDTNDLLKSDFSRSDFKTHFTDILRANTLIGTAIGKVGYKLEKDIVMSKERRKVSVAERALALLMGREVEPKEDIYEPKPMIVKDYASMEYRDLYKIFPQPDTTEISKDNWIIEESTITNKELIELSEHEDEYLRLRNVTPDLLGQSGRGYPEEDAETQARRWALQQRSTAINYFDPETPHQLLEYWGPVPLWMVNPEARDNEATKYNTVNAWIWVIDGQYVVRAVLNPYWDGEPPYFKTNYIRVPGDFYGIGAGELMMGLQIHKNEAVNTKSDNVNLVLNKVAVVLKDKIPKGLHDRLVSSPGQLWYVENVQKASDAIFPIEFPNLIQDIYATINELDRAIEEVTGAVKATIGVGGSSSEVGGGTFRGQLMNRSAAAERFMVYARTLERSGLVDAYKKMTHRVYQYKSYESVNSILGDMRGKKFEFIHPRELEQVARVSPMGVMAYETKGVKLAQMDQFAKTWSGKPWLKEYDLARAQWLEMGYSDPDSVMFTEDELKQFNQIRQAITGGGGLPSGPPQPGGPGGPLAGPSVGPSPVAGGAAPAPDRVSVPPLPAQGPGATPGDLTGGPL